MKTECWINVEKLLNGKQLEYSRVVLEVILKKAERKSKGKEPKQERLEF